MTADEEREFYAALARCRRALDRHDIRVAVRHLNAAWAIFKAAGHSLT